MIKLEKTEVVGWEHAIRGMRNPKNSWDRMDSGFCGELNCFECPEYKKEYLKCSRDEDDPNEFVMVGPNDHKLMMQLASGGPVHAKYRRMITVYVDITAPLYWWKEFDTYKVGTVANSCSTMHKIHDKEFTLEDFSHEHLTHPCRAVLDTVIHTLNNYRTLFVNWDEATDNTKNAWRVTDKKDVWWQMIQLLPSSYNQKRTVQLNYEVLAGIYPMRKNHKLDEWHVFCDWIKSLPYSEIITGPRDGKALIDGSVNAVEKVK